MRHVLLLLSGSFLFNTSGALAGIISDNTYIWMEPATDGQISIHVTVETLGAKYLWRYMLTNLSYEPIPGATNSVSGFNIFMWQLPAV